MAQSRLPPRYRLIEEVGQGGMAVVYRAHDEALSREVAVKVLHPHLLAEPESKARLEREARAVARLHHDNILQIFDYSGIDSPSAFLVTEFIEGQTLKQALAERKVPLPEIGALVAMEVADALRHAHGLGIIHRDIKPENVMVRSDGAIKLTDFGVAQVVELERMTVTGQLLGSPAYMPPELLEGGPADARSDVFSLGVMLYQLVTGTLPFAGRNPHEVLKRISEARFKDPRTLNRLVSDALARVIARALARKPDDRYQNVAAFWEDLRVYVSAAGFEDIRGELKKFFTTPADAHEAWLVPHVVRSLVEAGRREHAARRMAKALELWNRALALDADNAEIHAELRRLEGRQRLRRGGVLAGGALLFGGLIYGVFHFARGTGEAEEPPGNAQAAVAAPPAVVPPSPSPPEPAANPDPVASLPADPEPAEVTAKPTRPGVQRPLPKLAKAKATRAPASSTQPVDVPRVVFTLGANPAHVEVYLDGTKQFDYGLDSRTLEVPWDGPHTVEFRNDACCLRAKKVVGPNHGRPPGDHLSLNLERRVARLTVDVLPPQKNAKIMVAERSDGRANKAGPTRFMAEPGVASPVRFGVSEDLRKVLEVTVLADDRTFTDTVTVTAGQPSRLTIQVDRP